MNYIRALVVSCLLSKGLYGQLVINEILASPFGIDANGDEDFNSGDDRFIEFVNNGLVVEMRGCLPICLRPWHRLPAVVGST